jgi:guanosine-3',5'-bis(diphosphate) 3'-pyrophosphohydrolase
MEPSWLAELANAHGFDDESAEFVEGLKRDFFSHRVFVFTPRGDVIDLPMHSTPIDFAYAIHSELGNHVAGAKVNGKLVTFDTRLRNGDIVEITEKPSAHPTAKWMDFARTSMARRHIRNALEHLENGTKVPSLAQKLKPSSKPAKKKKHAK